MDDLHRTYNRKTVERVYKEFIERIKNIDTANLLVELDDLVVFGSYVNSTKEKLHDLDIYFTFKLKEEAKNDPFMDVRKQAIINDNRKYLLKRYVDIIDYPQLQLEFYLKNKSPIISLHDILDEPHAFRHYHGYIVKNGKYLDNPLFEKGFGD